MTFTEAMKNLYCNLADTRTIYWCVELGIGLLLLSVLSVPASACIALSKWFLGY